MQKTELFALMQHWRHEEIMGMFANAFLRVHDDVHKRLMIEAMSAVCSKEQINEALAVIGKDERIGDGC